MSKSSLPQRGTSFRYFRRYRMEIATLLAVSGAAACAVNDRAEPEKVRHTSNAIITSAQGVAAAQRAINYAVPAAVAFTQQNNCLSCHRQPDVLISASTAASLLPDILLDRSTATGTGFIANLVTGNQQPDGRWDDSGSTTSMSGESLWALAGYARAGGSLNVLPSIKAGLLWVVPQSSSITFPADGGPFAGAQRSYLHNDFTGAPQMFDWYLPTTQTVFASKVLLDLDTTLGAADVATLSAQQVSYTDALEGVTMRALTTSTVQQLSLASVAMAESGRARSANAQAIGAEILTRQTAGQGWGDPRTPDGTLAGVNNLTTGQAMYALCRLGLRPRVVPAVGAGLDWLTSQQQVDGSWPVGGHEPSVSTSWALLAVACASDTRGTAAFDPQTGNGTPNAPVAETLTTTLNITNSAADARMTSIAITGGPPGAVITVTPSTLSIEGDATAPVAVTVKLPKGLLPSVSYPFQAAISFEANGESAASTASAKYTAAIGALPDPLLADTTTTLPSAPTQVQVGSTVSLAALVSDAVSDPVTGGTVEYSLDGAPFVTVSVNPSSSLFSTSWSVPAMPLGNHTLHVAFLGDVPGGFNASSMDQIIDVEQPPPPAPTLAGIVDGSTSSTGSYALTGTGTPGDTVAIVANGVLMRTALIGSDGKWSAPLSLNPGTFVVAAVETGPGGPSTPTTRNVTVLPSAPIVAGPASGTTFTGMVTTVSGLATPGATVTVTRNGVVVATTTAAEDGIYSVGVDLVDGPNALSVSQTVNGQTSTLSGVTYNKTPAAPSIVSPTAGTGPQKTGAVVVSGDAVPGSSVVLLDNGAVVGSAVAGSDGHYSISATLPDGDHSLTTTASVGGVASAPSTAVSMKIVLSKPFFPAAPVDLTAYAPDTKGVAVDWPAVAAYSALDGQLSASCLPAARSVFPVGTTAVACSAVDSVGNTVQTRFAVKVILQVAPTFSLPAAKDMVVNTMLPNGANVSFDVSALDAQHKPLAAVCAPASGFFFPLGTTKVSCVATDTLAKTTASASFEVKVIHQDYTPGVAAAATTSDTVAGGGCSVSRASSSTSTYGSLGLLGLVLAAARRIRRRSSTT